MKKLGPYVISCELLALNRILTSFSSARMLEITHNYNRPAKVGSTCMSARNPIEPEENSRYWQTFEQATNCKHPALLTKEQAARILGIHPDDLADLEEGGILPRAGKKIKKGATLFSLRRVVELRNDVESLDKAVDALKAGTAAKNAKKGGQAV